MNATAGERDQVQAPLAAEQARSTAVSAELNGTRAELAATNSTLDQTQTELRTAQSAVAGAAPYSIVALAAALAAGGGIASGWAMGKRRKS